MTKDKKPKKAKVVKTRNAGTWTESQFWGSIRAVLRNKSRWWIPRLNALKAARRKSQSSNLRLKWEFLCADCELYHPQKNVQAHHTTEAGSLKSGDDLKGFIERLFAESGWICLCKECHKKRHS